MSYVSQILGLAAQSLFAGAAGLAVGIAFIRGFANDRSTGLGNFWVDLVRAALGATSRSCSPRAAEPWDNTRQLLMVRAPLGTLYRGKRYNGRRPAQCIGLNSLEEHLSARPSR
jgi:hypothetical protein